MNYRPRVIVATSNGRYLYHATGAHARYLVHAGRAVPDSLSTVSQVNICEHQPISHVREMSLKPGSYGIRRESLACGQFAARGQKFGRWANAAAGTNRPSTHLTSLNCHFIFVSIFRAEGREGSLPLQLQLCDAQSRLGQVYLPVSFQPCLPPRHQQPSVVQNSPAVLNVPVS